MSDRMENEMGNQWNGDWNIGKPEIELIIKQSCQGWEYENDDRGKGQNQYPGQCDESEFYEDEWNNTNKNEWMVSKWDREKFFI